MPSKAICQQCIEERLIVMIYFCIFSSPIYIYIYSIGTLNEFRIESLCRGITSILYAVPAYRAKFIYLCVDRYTGRGGNGENNLCQVREGSVTKSNITKR